MHHLNFYFDPVSPYACLAFEQLPQVLEGLSVEVSYRPVLLAGLLREAGQKGPAEIPAKRAWTYRQVLWLARQQSLPMQLPAAHPFNPLALLRLCWACTAQPSAGDTPNRWVCEAVLRHVWRGGAAADDAGRLAALTAQLAPRHDPRADDIKAALRAATDAAVARGIFGVPTVEAGGRLFFGRDGLDMLAASLRGDAWFDGPDWAAAPTWPVGVQRQP